MTISDSNINIQIEERTCLYCGNILNKQQKKYCSKQCVHESQKRRIIKKCLQCGKTYDVIESQAKESKYCSCECYNKGQIGRTPWNKKESITKKCNFCGSIFEVIDSRKNAEYCSRMCYKQDLQNKLNRKKETNGFVFNHNEEAKRKMMTSKLGIEKSFFDSFENYERLQSITSLLYSLNKNKNQDNLSNQDTLYLYEKIYESELYSLLLEAKNDCWLIGPSLDHKISLFNGGATNYQNICLMTISENYAKKELNYDEWKKFKDKHNISFGKLESEALKN